MSNARRAAADASVKKLGCGYSDPIVACPRAYPSFDHSISHHASSFLISRFRRCGTVRHSQKQMTVDPDQTKG